MWSIRYKCVDQRQIIKRKNIIDFALRSRNASVKSVVDGWMIRGVYLGEEAIEIYSAHSLTLSRCQQMLNSLPTTSRIQLPINPSGFNAWMAKDDCRFEPAINFYPLPEHTVVSYVPSLCRLYVAFWLWNSNPSSVQNRKCRSSHRKWKNLKWFGTERTPSCIGFISRHVDVCRLFATCCAAVPPKIQSHVVGDRFSYEHLLLLEHFGSWFLFFFSQSGDKAIDARPWWPHPHLTLLLPLGWTTENKFSCSEPGTSNTAHSSGVGRSSIRLESIVFGELFEEWYGKPG